MRVAGFGFRSAATAGSLRDALERAGGPEGIATLAAATDRAGAACLHALASELALPIAPVAAAAAQAAATLTRSSAALAARGAGSLAEATALAAAGPGGRLLGPRSVSRDRLAACAIAESADA